MTALAAPKTPVIQGRPTGQEEVFVRSTVNHAGMLVWVAKLQFALLQQHEGFRHHGVQLLQRSNDGGPIRNYDVAGLEGEATFQVSYEDAVRAGRRFESAMPVDWSDNDSDY